GITFLNEVVNTMRILEPNRILDELRDHVMVSLKQKGVEDAETKDGMDLALIVIDKPNMKLQYSGAYNPLYFVRPLSAREKGALSEGNEIELGVGAVHNDQYMLEQVKADKMPIGISIKHSQPFTMHELDLKPGYSIYINSDGYVDQFGGARGKKFMSRSFKKMLLELQDLPMSEQGRILDDRLLAWQGTEHPQIDDIIVIGIHTGK
ncbi:MAG: SpoIIE family protein phosphatase, partial [Bacteroidales bacterium]|nr:SpoIIE family protein phosphatase [Bacteroidales bacterium]